MKPTDYLFLIAIVIVLSTIVFGEFKEVVVDSANSTATHIREAGHR